MNDPADKPISYRDAGVDLDRYDEAIERIGRLVRTTHTARVLPVVNSFAGLFRLEERAPLFARQYRRPVLVASTDGVGTKLQVAVAAGRHDTVGIDLVAMCVNDCLAMGGEPLFFLDYIALGKDDPPLVEELVRGIAAGCQEANCALLGGETAIMPGHYPQGLYDMAGFCVAVVEEYKIVTGEAIRPGDVILGMASSGLHANGYSLVRHVVFDRAGLKPDDFVADLGTTVAEELLRPTRIYVRPVLNVLAHYRVKRVIRGIAHITGGGIPGNLKRILPHNVDAVLRWGSWPVPAVFAWLERLGPIEWDEMLRVFNLGLGMVMVVRPYYADSILERLRTSNCPAWAIGHVEAGSGRVRVIR